ncbi:hypothetical protein FMUND_10339 [Fusarium mundagurra]|uniref:BZIP domain-containing protein n=1 Tax=Fusarium mundagurra TaxID=1567541 RepID=A0A8H5YB98_9HYPO|nr:hypothetical protein FMUND_10339 [Fusarium mundagurra]
MLEHSGYSSVVSESNKQRRKIQNRKNQRARRQRLKGQDAGNDLGSIPFEIRRWRVDEVEDIYCQDTTVYMQHPPCHTLPSTTKDTIVAREWLLEPELAQIWTVDSKPQSVTLNFPLPSDHLLHLIQYNVFRAFLSNKRTLNTISLDSRICSVYGPCLDDTTRYPPNPNIPPSLAPTTLQLTQYHFPWINILPFPRVRDNIIRCEGRFDNWELWQDLVGYNMRNAAATWQRGTPVTFSAPAPRLEQPPTLIAKNYVDMDELTAERNGLIIWGEPHDMQNWEATPSFLKKWSWIVEGCPRNSVSLYPVLITKGFSDFVKCHLVLLGKCDPILTEGRTGYFQASEVPDLPLAILLQKVQGVMVPNPMSEIPVYNTGWAFVMSMQSASIVLALLYRFIAAHENKKRDAAGFSESFDHAFVVDETDKSNMNFRYVY